MKVATDAYDAHVLNQVTEAYRYIGHSGHVPRRARILTGHEATVVSRELDSGRRRVFAPCLRFPDMELELVELAGHLGLPFVNLYTNCLEGIGECIATGRLSQDGFSSGRPQPE